MLQDFVAAAILTRVKYPSLPPSPPPQPADDHDQIATSPTATVSTIQFSTYTLSSSSSSSASSTLGLPDNDIASVYQSSLTLGAILGEGSFGIVTEVHSQDGDDDKKVVKWIKYTTDDDEEKSFRKEASIIAGLSHPNVLRFHCNVVREDGHLVGYMVENATGGSLRDLMNRNQSNIFPKSSLSALHRFQLALDTAKGLAYLHTKGICHFDIKPENLLIDGSGVVKVGDFGTSFKVGERKHNIIGSPIYISPEMWENYRHADEKADVWSLGVVYWELLTGEMPYGDDFRNGNRDFQKGVVTGSLKLEIPVNCEDSWRVLLEMCLEIDPVKRASMQSIVEYLEVTIANGIADGMIDGTDGDVHNVIVKEEPWSFLSSSPQIWEPQTNENKGDGIIDGTDGDIHDVIVEEEPWSFLSSSPQIWGPQTNAVPCEYSWEELC